MSDDRPAILVLSPGDEDQSCPRCRRIVLIGQWPFCPHGRKVGYGWKFARGKNPSRTEAFHAEARRNPFGGTTRD